MSRDAKDKLSSSLAIARQMIQSAEIAVDSSKKKELLGVIQNLEASIKALDHGVDDSGRPITPTMIGAGLNRMLEYMTQHGIWFRLAVNVSDDVQAQLYDLQDKMKAAVESLSKSRKSWWQIWK